MVIEKVPNEVTDDTVMVLPEESTWKDVEGAADEEAGITPPGPEKPTAPGPKSKMATKELLVGPVALLADAAPPPVVTDEEREALAKSAADLIDWYFPGGVEQWGPVYAFILTWGMVFAPRFAAAAARGKGDEAERILGAVERTFEKEGSADASSQRASWDGGRKDAPLPDPFSDHPTPPPAPIRDGPDGDPPNAAD